ncbi:hypothetical protein [Geodermatophilus sp. URMC 63]
MKDVGGDESAPPVTRREELPRLSCPSSLGAVVPRYRYISPWPAVFGDLEVGRNARVLPVDGRALPPTGSTVILLPGDEIELEQPSTDARLREVAGPRDGEQEVR